MDTASLQAFLTVARLRSFSRAAPLLHLTQPAVSKRIAALEASLGAVLFDRLAREVSLTEAGRALLPRALRIVEEMADCQRALHNLTGRVDGSLRIGTSHHIGLHRLPAVLRSYTARYPEVRLDLTFLASEDALQAVRTGDLELGIVTLPPTAAPPLETTEVWEDSLVVVTSREHPLAAEAELEPPRLERYPAILPDPGTYTRGLIDAALEQAGLTVHTAFTTNYLETIKMMVSVGLGWSVLPESMLGPEFVVHRLRGLRLRRHLGVVSHAGRTLSNAAQAMLRLLTSGAFMVPR